MALFKCKMCGGTLEIDNNASVATCEYCGMKQTLPRLDDERRANMYDRANHFRRNNEFDKAMGIYENILNEDNTDAEAYWSLVLCRYGVEYIEDPSSHKRIPTINRAQFTSVFDDTNYKSALQYATGCQRSIYEEEAKAINEIQKGILAISQKEEPFDVFICYKETDSDGRRTPDSVLANDLYHQFTQEGFRVFFSRITLEEKLGVAYEPYIFAALNSSKVMVVLGTRPEYFKAAWVKNEWSRYLSLIKNGAEKILIPAYKDMDPYDLPEEFSHLQAQDMSRLGFAQDLIRGVKKIVRAETSKSTVVQEIMSTGGNTNTAPLLKRVFMFLEDGDWNAADEYCEKVLDVDPENAVAYLGKLLSELRVRKQAELKNQTESFDNSGNYQKTLRFADEKLKTELTGYIECIKERNEHARVEGIYANAKKVMSSVDSENAYNEAAQLFESVSGYLDADVLAQICKEKADAKRLEGIRKAARIKKKVSVIAPVVCAIVAFIIVLFTVIIPNGKYNDAIALMDAKKYNMAISAFEELDGYKDSAQKIKECKYSSATELLNEGYIVEAYKIFVALGEYKGSIDKAVSIRTEHQFKFAEVGDYVSFGKYEQDNNTANGKENIEWIVLEIKDGKALLFSKKVLDYKEFGENWEKTWDVSTIRKWLNNDFFNSAFSADEKTMISMTTLPEMVDLGYAAEYRSASTRDWIFLLSRVETYGVPDSAMQCEATKYAAAKEDSKYWLLRSHGIEKYEIDGVGFDGVPAKLGVSCSVPKGIRPALWVNIDG